MKTERNILVAFMLNFLFSIFEFVGGLFTGSIAIISDAVHDMGDAIGIGISYFLERKSKKQPDKTHTYGYARYSVLGGAITTLILLLGSVIVIYNAIRRIISPAQIHYDGMILLAVIGAITNLLAAFVTRDGDSINQKAVNLHMIEDVLGWLVVLSGAIIMRFTNFTLIDPIMSIAVAVYILYNALKNLKDIIDLFVMKTPEDISVSEIKKEIIGIPGVTGAHHIHIWSMDGTANYATMHVVTNEDQQHIKMAVRDKLKAFNINHVTLELESVNEPCVEKQCIVIPRCNCRHHHHH